MGLILEDNYTQPISAATLREETPAQIYGEKAMKDPVPHEFVTQLWQEIGTVSTDQAPALINEMNAHQPALLAYLLAASEADYTQGGDIVLYMGVVVWQIMQRWYKSLMRVSVAKLEQAEEENLADLEMLAQHTETQQWTVADFLLENYPEPEVLRYIVEGLMEPDEDGIEILGEEKGLAFIHLKTALDTLIRCRPKS